ncbi:hypothetical protein TURU_100404 [Turdus rufiventris]|nr:hypothetical protein TURU_100404 [Turdus rufiventris]
MGKPGRARARSSKCGGGITDAQGSELCKALTLTAFYPGVWEESQKGVSEQPYRKLRCCEVNIKLTEARSTKDVPVNTRAKGQQTRYEQEKFRKIKACVSRSRTVLSFEDGFQVFEFGAKNNQILYKKLNVSETVIWKIRDTEYIGIKFADIYFHFELK